MYATLGSPALFISSFLVSGYPGAAATGDWRDIRLRPPVSKSCVLGDPGHTRQSHRSATSAIHDWHVANLAARRAQCMAKIRFSRAVPTQGSFSVKRSLERYMRSVQQWNSPTQIALITTFTSTSRVGVGSARLAYRLGDQDYGPAFCHPGYIGYRKERSPQKSSFRFTPASLVS